MKYYRVYGKVEVPHDCDCEYCDRLVERKVDSLVQAVDEEAAIHAAAQKTGIGFGFYQDGEIQIEGIAEDIYMREIGAPRLL